MPPVTERFSSTIAQSRLHRNQSSSVSWNSQKTLRVDVDLKFDRPAALRRLGEPAAQIGGEIVTARRFDQQTQAMATAHQSKRRLSRTKHVHALHSVFIERRRTRQFARISGGVVLVGAGYHDRGEPAERRIAAALARCDLRRIERFAVLRDERAHHRMLGLMSLQQPQADAGIAPGAPLLKPRSASMTPTRLSIGKWWPLATSCVPITMSKRPAATSANSSRI